MTRTRLVRLLGAAATVVALVSALTAVAGTGLAQSTAAQANYAPANTAAPTISANTYVGQTLTASNGTWNSDTTPSFSYQWQRCDKLGNGCSSISGATSQTYVLQSGDVGSTLRVVVTAKNSSGSSSATSAQTAEITAQAPSSPAPSGPAGAVKTTKGATSIPASSVTLPERLIINGVGPAHINGRQAFVERVHVVDTRGFVVRDALVHITGLPYSWARSAGEVRTDMDGWANVTVTPTRNMPIRPRTALVMFVRARVEGQSLLSGSSTRRLVQVTIP
jgi:hypothetical protein